MAESPRLGTLPTELQNLIVLNLLPSAAVALKQTNRWFYTHVSLRRLDRVAVRDYLQSSELKIKNEHLYACFSCLCLKPETAFTFSHIGQKTSQCRPRCYDRFCLDCGIVNGAYSAGTSRLMAGSESTRKVLCGVCMSVQSYYCSRCYCCKGCIASIGTWTGRAARRSQAGGQALCQTHFRR